MNYGRQATLLTACIVCAAQQSAFDVARSLQDLGRYAEAEKYYQRALKSDPRSVPALTNLGVVLARQGKYRANISMQLPLIGRLWRSIRPEPPRR